MRRPDRHPAALRPAQCGAVQFGTVQFGAFQLGAVLPGVLGAVLLGAVLSGCSTAAPDPAPTPTASSAPPPAAGFAAALALRDDLRAALEGAYPDIAWSADDAWIQRQPDGECTVSPGTLRTRGDLGAATAGLGSLPSLLDPVLARHGMGPLAAQEAKGGWTVLASAGGDGSRPEAMHETVAVRAKGRAEVSVTVGTASASCSPEEIRVTG